MYLFLTGSVNQFLELLEVLHLQLIDMNLLTLMEWQLVDVGDFSRLDSRRLRQRRIDRLEHLQPQYAAIRVPDQLFPDGRDAAELRHELLDPRS